MPPDHPEVPEAALPCAGCGGSGDDLSAPPGESRICRRCIGTGKEPTQWTLCRNCLSVTAPGENPSCVCFSDETPDRIEVVPLAILQALDAEVEKRIREEVAADWKGDREAEREAKERVEAKLAEVREVLAAVVKAVTEESHFTWEEIEELARPELMGDGEWSTAWVEISVNTETLVAARTILGEEESGRG